MALEDEVRDLTRALRELIQDRGSLGGSTSKKMSDESSKLLDAIALLVRRLDRNTKSAADAVEDFRKEIDDATKSLEDKAKAERDRLAAEARARKTEQQLREEEAEARKQAAVQSRENVVNAARQVAQNARYGATVSQKLYDEMTYLGGGTGLLKQQFEDLGKGSLAGTVALQGLSAGAQGLLNATKAMAGGLYKGERGATVSAKALTELVKPLTTFGNILGGILLLFPQFRLLGLVITGLSTILNKYMEVQELAAEQLDTLTKQFFNLGRAGISLERGIDGVFQMGQVAGVTVSQMEEFNRLLAENTTNLAMMGGTAARGAERFAQIAGVVYKELGRDLELLGVSASEQREIALSYLQIQERTGRIQNTTIGELAKRTANYIRELDELAEITGTTRKQQQEAREAALAETRFRAARVVAEQTGDVEYTRILDIAEKAAAAAKAAGDIRGFTGALQVGAARGALTTPEAIAAEQTYRLSELFTRNPTQVEIAQHMAASVRVQQQSLAATNVMAGNIDVLQTDFVKSADFAKRQEVLAREAAKAGYQGNEGIQQYLRDIQQGRVQATPEMQAIIDGQRAQQNAALMMDAAVRTFSDAANLSLQASQTFAKAVGLAPGTTVAGGQLKTGAAGAPGAGEAGPSKTGAAGAAGGYGRGGQGSMGGSLASTAAGAAVGAALGSVVPIIGTAVGGILGGMAGFAGYQTMGGGQPTASINPEDVIKFAGGLTGTREHFDKLDPAVRGAFLKMAVDYNNLTGDKLQINSAFRSPGEQAAIDPGANPKAAPGMSLHNVGRAIDIQPNQKNYLMGAGLLDRYGFKTLPNDPPHIFMQTGGVATGPRSGYSAVLHGTEAVVPLPDGKTIPVEMPNLDRNMEQQVSMMGAQLVALEELVRYMRDNTAISAKILQAANN